MLGRDADEASKMSHEAVNWFTKWVKSLPNPNKFVTKRYELLPKGTKWLRLDSISENSLVACCATCYNNS